MAVGFTFDGEKGKAAIAYLASRHLPDLSKGKICKLIFLADKHHLVRFGRTVTGDRICAMKDGPVPSNVLNILNLFLVQPDDPSLEGLTGILSVDRRYINPHFSAQDFKMGDFLSESDTESLDAIVAQFGNKTFSYLRALTHDMTAYKNAWENRVTNNPDMSFEDMFEDDDEALAGAYQEMLESDGLRKVFGTVF